MITPEEYRKKYESAGIYCEHDNIERHIRLEYDGMTYCQHCYREMKEENRMLKHRIETLKELYKAIFGRWLNRRLVKEEQSDEKI